MLARRANLTGSADGDRGIAEVVLESAVDYAIIATDREGRVTFWNPGAENVLGWSADEIIGQPADVFFTPEDRAKGVLNAEKESALASGKAADERWHLRKDGSRFWARGELLPLRGAEEVVGFLKIMRDRTEQRQAEELQELLNVELVHRVKNLFAMLQSIVSQTLRDDVNVGEARESILSRLEVLSGAQDALLTGFRSGTSVRVVLERALRVHEHNRGADITIEGPHVALPAATAMSLALITHELATNAVKYGALSDPAGHVDVHWREAATEGGSGLELSWRETGGPPVEAPTRKGFGTRLIEHGIPAADSRVELRFPPEGLTCTLVCSLPQPE
jgi:PAS domain S-box-containing protein